MHDSGKGLYRVCCMIAAQKRSSVADPAKLDFSRGMPPSLTAYLMVAPGQPAGSGEASPRNNIVPSPRHHIVTAQ